MTVAARLLPAALVFVVAFPSASYAAKFERLSDHFEMKRSSRVLTFYVMDGKKRQEIGSTVGEDEQALGTGLTRKLYAVSEDGKRLLYLQLRNKPSDGLYLHTYGKGGRLLSDRASIGWGREPTKPLPDNILVYQDPSLEEPPRFASTEGEDAPLALLGASDLHTAAYEGQIHELIRLLEAGADIDAVTYWGFTALQTATVRGHEEVAIRLIESGADPDAGEGDSLLAVATCYGRMGVLAALVEKGADINAPLSFDRRAIHLAMRPDNWAVGTEAVFDASLGEPRVPEEALPGLLRWLLEHGADPNVPGPEGKTPLHLAVGDGGPLPRAGNVDLVEILLEHSADPDARDEKGNTPLHYAGGGNERYAPLWKQECRPIIELLASRTADIDARNNKGWTPLQVKVYLHQIRTARVLIEHGADDSLPAMILNQHPNQRGSTIRQVIEAIAASAGWKAR